MTSTNRKCSALTGSSRKTKDNAADWFNLMLRWNRLNDEGFNVAANIVNSKRSQQGVSDSAPLQDDCRTLQDVVDKMVTIVTKMERLTASQSGVRALDDFRTQGEGHLFHGWSCKDLEVATATLLVDFRQELRLKQTILQEVAHTVTSDLGLVLLSGWLHQPFITDRTRLTVEALLMETGLRPL
ncbi:cyclin-dependent kinase 2-interacting protein [Gouania willdenowi]|uniref:cyclin-dependent kinase 2-interacting protein n=1 Tax=Gouania willdenowi TaxID=441366 RepID=UPI001055A998|nr:cyclin-dependent kinase 2-interacting protein [Gouania willdenowi]XP_028294690.1 cyclin-dependent kinase 2-interacting protein [Gouania willdenowi]